MEHVFVSLLEFLLLVGALGIAVIILLLLGLGASVWGIARIWTAGSRQKRQARERSEVERLRRQLLAAQDIAYESAVASERTIQHLQQRLSALEAERPQSFVSVRR